MSSTVKIPKDYDITLHGGVRITPDPATVTLAGDAAHPLQSVITGDPAHPVAALLTGDPAKPVTATLQGNPAKPLATTVDLLNLPHLTLDQLKDLLLPKMRVQMPNYEQVCFKLFGLELFSICLSGEMQMITRPFEPNVFERCEIECCPRDTRPFPEQTPTHRDVRVEAERPLKSP